MKKSHLKQIIQEILSKPKKDSCNCGCHSCENVGNPGVLINESVAPKEILSENLRYHVNNKLPLTENTFRYGSESFLNLWAEARALYLREIIHVNEDDKQILEETDLGNYGLYEGKEVPLDLPMIFEGQDAVCATCGEHGYDDDLDRPCTNCGDDNWSTDYENLGDEFGEIYEAEDIVNISIHTINGQRVVLATLGSEKVGALRLKPYKDSYQVDSVIVKPEYQGMGIGSEMYREANEKHYPLYSDQNQTAAAKALWDKLIQSGEAKEEDGRYVMLPSQINSSLEEKEGVPHYTKDGKEWTGKTHKMSDGSLMSGNPHDVGGSGPNGESEKLYHKEDLNETTKKKKNPPLNKPKRGGSKAYYVYVKDPKTKRIKKVSFGSGGLKAKINNPKARQAFAKRHRCSEKTDKTKASYWSCRLPRYAKLLGLKSSFSGFW